MRATHGLNRCREDCWRRRVVESDVSLATGAKRGTRAEGDPCLIEEHCGSSHDRCDDASRRTRRVAFIKVKRATVEPGEEGRLRGTVSNSLMPGATDSRARPFPPDVMELSGSRPKNCTGRRFLNRGPLSPANTGEETISLTTRCSGTWHESLPRATKTRTNNG